MNNSLLKDLDILILECRNPQSREYIKEAVNCYRVGAFRASIIMCWIAVACDYMDKLKELELTEDAGAIEQLLYFRSIQDDRNPDNRIKQQKFENQILEHAKEKFEFITTSEFNELQRLKEDRNRCAHLSVSSEEILFKPSAELTRFHIVSAVSNFIKNPAAQGKSALDLIDNLLNSQLFPIVEKNVIKAIQNSPLANGRDSLVRSFIISSLKGLYVSKTLPRSYYRVLKALPSCTGKLRTIYLDTMGNKLSNIFRQIDDDDLYIFINDMRKLENAWEALQDSDQDRIKQYIEIALTDESVFLFEDYLLFPPLKESAEKCINSFDHKKLNEFIQWCTFSDQEESAESPKRFIINKAIDLYVDSGSFLDANNLGPGIARVLDYLSLHELEKLKSDCESNGQVSGSNYWTNSLAYKIDQYIKSHTVEASAGS